MEDETDTSVVYGVFNKDGRLIDSGDDPNTLLNNLTVKQFKLMLRRISVSSDDIRNAIRQALPTPEAIEDALIEFEYSVAFERTHPLVGIVAARLGYSKEQMDDMWRQAMKL